MKRAVAFGLPLAALTVSIGLLIRQIAFSPSQAPTGEPPRPSTTATAVPASEELPRTAPPRLVAPSPPQAAEQPKPPPGPAPDTVPGSARAHLELVQQRFRAETPDAAWSQRSSSQLQAALDKGLPAGSRVVSLECRTTMCRAELYHPSLEDFHEVVGEGFGAHGWKGPWMASLVESPDGRGTGTVAFLGREGTELPMPESN